MTKKENTRICNSCKKEKPLEEFYLRKNSPCGYVSECKICSCERAKRWQAKNYEKKLESARKTYHKYREKNRERSKMYYQKNRSHITKTNKLWRVANKEKIKVLSRNTVLARYGITLADYDRMFERQSGNCAICGLPEITRRLSVDHNHDTGEIRALLCSSCNFLIGQSKENPEVLLKAAEYLTVVSFGDLPVK